MNWVVSFMGLHNCCVECPRSISMFWVFDDGNGTDTPIPEGLGHIKDSLDQEDLEELFTRYNHIEAEVLRKEFRKDEMSCDCITSNEIR